MIPRGLRPPARREGRDSDSVKLGSTESPWPADFSRPVLPTNKEGSIQACALSNQEWTQLGYDKVADLLVLKVPPRPPYAPRLGGNGLFVSAQRGGMMAALKPHAVGVETLGTSCHRLPYLPSHGTHGLATRSFCQSQPIFFFFQPPYLSAAKMGLALFDLFNQ